MRPLRRACPDVEGCFRRRFAQLRLGRATSSVRGPSACRLVDVRCDARSDRAACEDTRLGVGAGSEELAWILGDAQRRWQGCPRGIGRPTCRVQSVFTACAELIRPQRDSCTSPCATWIPLRAGAYGGSILKCDHALRLSLVGNAIWFTAADGPRYSNLCGLPRLRSYGKGRSVAVDHLVKGKRPICRGQVVGHCRP